MNSSILLKGDKEEIALTVAGKKKKLNRNLLINYFGKERCGLTDKVIESTLSDLNAAKKSWFSLLNKCFMKKELKKKYRELLEKRLNKLDL